VIAKGMAAETRVYELLNEIIEGHIANLSVSASSSNKLCQSEGAQKGYGQRK
jgi:hypothetical protein